MAEAGTYGGIDSENTIPGGAPQRAPRDTICGLRRKVFFVVLSITISVLLAGLSTTLGILLSRRNNSDIKINEGSIPQATPGGSANTITDSLLPEPTRFALTTGSHTITLTQYSTSGVLCPYFELPKTTTIHPYITSNAIAYTATWIGSVVETITVPGGGSMLTKTTVPSYSYSATAIYTRPVASVEAWDFLQPLDPSLDGTDCEFNGLFQLMFENSKTIRLIFTVVLMTETSCLIGDKPFVLGSDCYIYWDT